MTLTLWPKSSLALVISFHLLVLLQVYYYIVENTPGSEFFTINPQTGEIATKAVFDRETRGAYALNIEARDGRLSSYYT